MKRLIIMGLTGLACAGFAPLQTPTVDIAAADLIGGRQSAMLLSGVTMGAMKGAIDGQQPIAGQRFNARSLARWAHAVPGMFPAGSGAEAGVRTNARPEVWTDRAGFEAKAAEYAAAADRLAELAVGEDAAAFAAQWTVVRASCQSCHDGYKAG